MLCLGFFWASLIFGPRAFEPKPRLVLAPAEQASVPKVQANIEMDSVRGKISDMKRKLEKEFLDRPLMFHWSATRWQEKEGGKMFLY